MVTTSKKSVTQSSIKERRKYKRRVLNQLVELIPAEKKEKIKCATYDISEGGIRVVSSVELTGHNYTIVLENQKIKGKLVFEETRKSSMMNQTAYYHGFAFLKPIPSSFVSHLISTARKRDF